jgi:flagellar basal-body rod protein FlgC
MSGPFHSIEISATGLDANALWLDRIADNIANANDVVPGDQEPFRATRPIFAPIDGGSGGGDGVEVAGEALQEGETALVFDPDHPLADANGNIAPAAVDLATEMTDMVLATRSYQANIQAVRDAKERYEAALRIGG